MGARALDCPARGGLGFVPMEHSHAFTGLGIHMERTEREGGPKFDSCYAARLSLLDSDSDTEPADDGAGALKVEEQAAPGFSESVDKGVPLLYEGDPVVLSQGEGAWLPVVVASPVDRSDPSVVQCAFPSEGSPVEVVPGLWDDEGDRGMLCVMSTDELDTVIEPGVKLAEVHPAVVQTRACQDCGCLDTDAWIAYKDMPRCDDCGTAKVGGKSDCRQCGASAEACCVLSYRGCGSCRPEAQLKGKVRRGPAAGMLARSALTFAALMLPFQTGPLGSEPRPVPAAPAGRTQTQTKHGPVTHPVFPHC